MNDKEFDKLIKAKYLDRNDGLDYEALWNKVEPQLNKEKSKKRRFFFFFIGGAIAIFVLIVLFLWKNSNDGVKPIVADNESLVIKSGSLTNKIDDFSLEKNDTPVANTDMITTLSESPEVGYILNASDDKTKQPDVIQVIASNIQHDQRYASIPVDSKTTYPEGKREAYSDTLPFINHSGNEVATVNVKDDDVTVRAGLSETSMLPSLPLKELAVQIMKATLDLLIPSTVEAPLIKELYVDIGYFAVANIYGTTDEELHEEFLLRKRTEQPLDAQSLSLGYAKQLKGGLFLTIALRYQKLWDKRLDTYTFQDSMYLENVVVGHRIDAFGSKEILESGNFPVDVERSIKRYLSTTTFGIPIGIRYQIPTGSTAAMYIGGGIEPILMTSRRGIIYHNNNYEYDLEDDTDQIYHHGFKTRTYLNLGVRFNLGGTWKWHIGLASSMPLYNTYSHHYLINKKQLIYGLNTGISMSF